MLHVFPVRKFYWFYLPNISRISPHLPASIAPNFCKAALVSQLNDSNSFLKKVYASTFTPTVSSLVSTPAKTCRFLSQNFRWSSYPITVQAIIFGVTQEAPDVPISSPPTSAPASLPLWLTVFQEWWLPEFFRNRPACCGLRASELCFPFPQSPFPRETHSLTPFTSLLLYHLPSDVFIGSFTKNCKAPCSTHWHPFVLSCSVFPIDCGIRWHHFHLTLLHGDMDIEVQLRPSPVSCEGCTPLVTAAKNAVKSGPGRCEAASVMHTIQMPTGLITP